MTKKERFAVILLTMLFLLSALPIQSFAATKASIKLKPKKITITAGDTRTLTPTVKGKSQKVTWKSSNTKVAAVNSSGKITAKKAGKATITAKANGKTAKCTVTVKKSNYAKAYAAFLKKHPSKSSKYFYDASYSPSDKSFVSSFFLYDMDKNNVPELFTYTNVNFRWHIVRVYTYKNGKVTAVKSTAGSKMEFDNCAVANGSYSLNICKKGHIHNSYTGGMASEEYVYKKSGSKIAPWLTYSSYNSWNGNYESAQLQGGSITISKYNSLTKSCKNIKITTYKNSSTNRTKLQKGKCKVNK